MRSLVAILGLFLLWSGCVAPKAIEVTPHLADGNTANASLASTGDAPANKAGPATQTATDKGWNIGQIAVAGSGWPLAVVVVLIGVVMLRTRKQAVTGIAQAVQDMGPGSQRDALLTSIKSNLAAVPAAKEYLTATVQDANLDVNKRPTAPLR